MATYEDGAGSMGTGWYIVFFLFFLLAWGGNGFGGFGGNGAASAALTRSELTDGFNNQDVQRKLNSIGSGICDGFYAQNTTMLNGFNNLQNSYLQNSYQTQLSNLQAIGNVNTNITGVGYGVQQGFANVEQAIAHSTCAINANNTANTQAILDRLCYMENQDLRDKLAAKDRDVLKYEVLQGQVANTQTILNAQGRYVPYMGYNIYGCGGCGNQ